MSYEMVCIQIYKPYYFKSQLSKILIFSYLNILHAKLLLILFKIAVISVMLAYRYV